MYEAQTLSRGCRAACRSWYWSATFSVCRKTKRVFALLELMLVCIWMKVLHWELFALPAPCIYINMRLKTLKLDALEGTEHGTLGYKNAHCNCFAERVSKCIFMMTFLQKKSMLHIDLLKIVWNVIEVTTVTMTYIFGKENYGRFKIKKWCTLEWQKFKCIGMHRTEILCLDRAFFFAHRGQNNFSSLDTKFLTEIYWNNQNVFWELILIALPFILIGIIYTHFLYITLQFNHTLLSRIFLP